MGKAEEVTAWDRLCKPPKDALKAITGGRLKGMTDVNPQWRYKAMHDVYGPCGVGWKYEVKDVWPEAGTDGQIFMFARVDVFVKNGDTWADPIPGVGGSMLIEKDKYGLHHNDEAVKMAVTDALSVALKMLGVAADIYMGRWDGSKYKDEKPLKEPITPNSGSLEAFTEAHGEEAVQYLRETAATLVDAVEAQNDVAAAVDMLAEAKLDNDEKLALWAILAPNSKTRNAIKKENERRRQEAALANEIQP